MSKNDTFRIPNSNKLSIPNTSDLAGNIEYTKNINLNEGGYIKLAPRVIAIQSESVDSNLQLPLSFGRTTDDKFFIATKNKSFIFNTETNNYIFTSDAGTNAPTATLQGYGMWWQNNWHVTDNLHLNVKDRTTGNWAQVPGTPITFSTTGVAHMMENFISLVSLVITDNNLIHQYDTNYAQIYGQLALPTDYEITGIAYNNHMLGIATKMTALYNSTNWQNQDAFFCIWDGATSKVNEEYRVPSDMIMSVCAYQSTWAILTRRGKLMYFTGGGLKTIATLPFDFKSRIWSDPLTVKAFAHCMQVDDDKIHINIPNVLNQYGTKGQSTLENYPGGVWTFDPEIGFYHRYSPSNSLAYEFGVTSGNINTTTGIFTTNTNPPPTGNPIKYVYDPANLIGGLTYDTVYYVIRIDSTHFKLASTRQNAIDGIAIIPTSGGAANNYFISLNVVDFGATLLPGNTGGIGLFGTETVLHNHMLFGSEIHDGATGNTYGNLCMVIPGFENRGYLVTSKLVASGITDNHQKLFIRYSPLKTNDVIIAKIKNDKVVGIPVSSPQFSGVTQWTTDTTFTTTCNISEAYTYFNTDMIENSLECEITSGSGAGQMSQISSITLNAGTYTVTLSDSITGATSGQYLNFLIDNFKLLLTTDRESLLTVSNLKGWAEYPITRVSKWSKVKIELRGDNTTIEDLTIINTSQQLPA